LPFISFPA